MSGASINKIGKSTVPRTAISTSDEHSITIRGEDLCRDLIGKISFTEYFSFLVTGQKPSRADAMVLDATLVAIADHGMVPSVQASRMTYAAAPDAPVMLLYSNITRSDAPESVSRRTLSRCLQTAARVAAFGSGAGPSASGTTISVTTPGTGAPVGTRPIRIAAPK